MLYINLNKIYIRKNNYLNPDSKYNNFTINKRPFT